MKESIDFIKLKDYAVINLNNMIPVPDDQIIDININKEKDPSYKYYGGRGIVVCDEWHNIENFEKWVETHPYKIGMTLDRIDPNGNYEPKNCRWATMFEQDNNRRNSTLIEYNGETHSISEWAIKLGINRSTLNNRYYRGDRGAKLFRRTENNHGKKWIKDGEKSKWLG